MIPDYVPDEWTRDVRQGPSEAPRRSIDPVTATMWWVVIPVALAGFWAVVVGLIVLAA